MIKHLSSLALAAALTALLTVSAGAAYIPDDVTYQNIDGQQVAVKVYTLLPDQDPEDLNEPAFDHGRYRYALADIVKEENRFDEQNTHTETVTVNTATKNLNEILKQMEPTMAYDDGTWSGTLTLDHKTIETKAAGYKKNSRTVTATKTYTGLERNDSSCIAPTVVKDGHTLSLSNVAWSTESTALVGEELVPATYAAVATYSGTASSTVATGYVTTADYVGTVTSSGVSSVQYTVTYLGTRIDPLESMGEGSLPVIAGAAVLLLVLAALLGGGLCLRKNLIVYRETETEGEYEKCGSLRIRAKRPEVKLDRLRPAPNGRIAVMLRGRTAKKLSGKTICLTNRGTAFPHTVGRVSGDYWFRMDVSVEEPTEQEEELT